MACSFVLQQWTVTSLQSWSVHFNMTFLFISLVDSILLASSIVVPRPRSPLAMAMAHGTLLSATILVLSFDPFNRRLRVTYARSTLVGNNVNCRPLTPTTNFLLLTFITPRRKPLQTHYDLPTTSRSPDLLSSRYNYGGTAKMPKWTCRFFGIKIPQYPALVM